MQQVSGKAGGETQQQEDAQELRQQGSKAQRTEKAHKEKIRQLLFAINDTLYLLITQLKVLGTQNRIVFFPFIKQPAQFWYREK